MKNEVEKNENKPLLENKDLEKTSGGYIYYADYKPTHKYEIINDVSGEVIARCAYLPEARQAASYYNQSADQINGDTLYRIVREDNTRHKIDLDSPPHEE